MEFFAIMFIGTVVAMFIVAGLRSPSSCRIYRVAPPLDLPGTRRGEDDAEIWQFQPMDQVEYWEAMELHVKDPAHNPYPSPIPPKIQPE
jgi:hypothetical protein